MEAKTLAYKIHANRDYSSLFSCLIASISTTDCITSLISGAGDSTGDVISPFSTYRLGPLAMKYTEPRPVLESAGCELFQLAQVPVQPSANAI